MALLEQQPVHVRRKIALGITLGVAFVLIVVLILSYSVEKKKASSPDATMTRWGHFYATMIESTQSFFSKERAIIRK